MDKEQNQQKLQKKDWQQEQELTAFWAYICSVLQTTVIALKHYFDHKGNVKGLLEGKRHEKGKDFFFFERAEIVQGRRKKKKKKKKKKMQTEELTKKGN